MCVYAVYTGAGSSGKRLIVHSYLPVYLTYTDWCIGAWSQLSPLFVQGSYRKPAVYNGKPLGDDVSYFFRCRAARLCSFCCTCTLHARGVLLHASCKDYAHCATARLSFSMPTTADPSLSCPHCGKPIALTESLVAPLVAATRAQYEQQLKTQADAFAAEKKPVAAQQQANEQRAAQLEEAAQKQQTEMARAVREQVQQQLVTERRTIGSGDDICPAAGRRRAQN